MRKNTFVAVAVGAALSFAAGAASADVLVSLNRADFATAISGLTVGGQDFDGFANGSLLTDDGFVAYSSSAGTPQITNAFLNTTGPHGLGVTGNLFFLDSDSMTFTFDSAVTAFGIDINTFATSAGAYGVILNTGDQAFSLFEAFSGQSTGQFLGFTSDTAFTSVTLTANTGFAYSLDTLVYASVAVPEPSTWAMLILGLGATGGLLRQRRRLAIV